MFPTVDNLAVFDLENYTAVNIQLLAVSLRAVVMHPDHTAIVTLAIAAIFD
jgi:hypothetical protein